MNSNLERWLAPAITAGLAAVFLLGVMMPESDAAGKMKLAQTARLPVIDGGRVMPLDTVARNKLMIISGRQTFVDDAGNSQPAVKWFFDVLVSDLPSAPNDPHGREVVNEAGLNDKVFRIENDQVLSLLHLPARQGFRYSIKEMIKYIDQFDAQSRRSRSKSPDSRDLYDNKVLELADHLSIYMDLRSMMKFPRLIPPRDAGEEWRFLPEAFEQDKSRGSDSAALQFASMLHAYSQGDAEAFNRALESYQKLIDNHMPAEASKTDFEAFFNHFAPFSNCAWLYVFVLILVCASWIAFPQQLNHAALALAGLTLVVHTFALFGRMYITGRPLVFVTNLYSSAVFIGWICVILGLVLEWIYHNSLGNFVAAVAGSLTLLIGHYLATDDTMGMMQAVLDTNFWLATHVTSVTIGYASTYVAGILGTVLICMGVFTTQLTKERYRTLGRMIYGVVCFAMLFSFVGTVLGGIWADQSWGRFWGWDPKENGALLIVLWNALILHARWGGLVQQRGMAVLAVAGNIITSWSWFGVNMLGVGLHSYGFMAEARTWLLTYVGSQLVLIGIGLVPLSKWPSFAVIAKPAPPLDESPVLIPAPAHAITAQPEKARNSKKSKRIKSSK